ncbi:MAG: ABC transporter substrate-binding protein [Lachnospiraceae bacterium]|nr:ABC transporter substrate-binding protein [Lachnospiraceae bacterium]
MKKTVLVTSAILTATLFLSACGGVSPAAGTADAPAAGAGSGGGTSAGLSGDDGELRIALNADIVNMDVHRNTNDYLIPMNVFDTLFAVEKNADGSSSIVKSLVDDYSISDDGLTYSFTLRDGVVFSDGTPLTADDVKFTFERILTLPDSQQTDYAISIKGAQDLLDKKADELSGITVQDDTHFTITLAEPFSGFLAQLATPSTSIFSRSLVNEAGEDFGIDPKKTIGTGPYIITSWEQGSGMTLEYNPRYWGSEPSVKKVTAKIMDPATMDMAFQKGDIDILDCLFLDSAIVDSVYKQKYADSIVSVDRLGMNYFILNEKIGPLSDVSVRKAIQMAVDRQSILDSIYSGDGKLEDGIFPSGCLSYSTDNQGWLKYDPEGAKKLLSDAGYPNGFDMEVSLDSSAAETAKRAIEIIAQNLQDVGINASIRSYDRASFLDLRNGGNMNSYLALWLLDYNDPDNVIYTFFGSRSNTVIRSNNYPDENVIGRIGDARFIVDNDKRMQEYAALEKKLVQDDAVWVPLYSLKHLFVKGERVASFTPQWAGWSDMYFSGVELK